MKKRVSILLAATMLLGLLSAALMTTVSADDEIETVVGQTTPPDWVITEIACDSNGSATNTNGYVGSQDCFEFIEIYNNSGKELNLYEYALTYNGNTRTSENFEHQITESTPIKAGDYLDGSSLVPKEGKAVFGDLSNKPVNPETCLVQPGEVVVLWMVYYESYLADFNEGKGMSIDDFRAHWNIPDDVKVIAVDANSSGDNGGNSKNFNVKNSAVATYGIAKQSDALNEGSNVKGASIDGNYWESEHLVCWVTMDFNDCMFNGSIGNLTYNFTWDFGGYAAIDQSYTYQLESDYVYDARRGYLLGAYTEPTAGTLTTMQKMTLGVALEVGETIEFVKDDTVYYPYLDEPFYGFLVNGITYRLGDTFTATEAGIYTFDYNFVGELPVETTEAPTEEPTEPVTDPVTEPETTAPIDDETTAEDTTTPATEAPTAEDEATTTEDSTENKGCGAVVGLSVLPLLLIPAAVVLKKKREE